MKNIIIYIIVIAVVATGAWLFTQKGSQISNRDLYASPSPSAQSSGSPIASPISTPVNTTKPSAMKTTASGLQYQDVVVGTGATAKAGDMVSVHYLGTFTNGTKFDSSYDRGQTFQFKLGAGGVIKGWDEGVAGMKVGGKRKLVIPPSLGYGPQDYGPIPGNSTLLFDVELVSIP